MITLIITELIFGHYFIKLAKDICPLPSVTLAKLYLIATASNSEENSLSSSMDDSRMHEYNASVSSALRILPDFVL